METMIAAVAGNERVPQFGVNHATTVNFKNDGFLAGYVILRHEHADGQYSGQSDNDEKDGPEFLVHCFLHNTT
jgi:hypothetical protein